MDLQWVANNLWPNPSVGQFVFHRMYLRNMLPNGAVTGGDHGMQCNIGDVKWAWLIYSGDASVYDMDVANSSESNISLATGIAKSEVQRIEWRLSRTSSSAGVTTFRIYSAAGTLLGEATRNLSSMTDALYRTARWGIAGLSGATYVGDGVRWGTLRFASVARARIGSVRIPLGRRCKVKQWSEVVKRVESELETSGESVVTVAQLGSRSQLTGLVGKMLLLGVTVTPIDASTVKLTKQT